ncbi:hypothetical protein [Nocardia sienata]|nr:hypothetical protein [Nocardia sienata]
MSPGTTGPALVDVGVALPRVIRELDQDELEVELDMNSRLTLSGG